jgi:hypothetical protein
MLWRRALAEMAHSLQQDQLMQNQRRRGFYVDPTFQKQLLWRLATYWVFYHMTLWHLMFLLNIVGTGISQDPTAPPKSFWAMYGEFTAEHLWVVVCFLVMMPVLGRDLLKFSHRISGPLVRFRNTLQAMADRKTVAPIKLREHDFLTDFAAVFNGAIETWNTRFQRQPSSPSHSTPSDSPELELVESR